MAPRKKTTAIARPRRSGPSKATIAKMQKASTALKTARRKVKEANADGLMVAAGGPAIGAVAAGGVDAMLGAKYSEMVPDALKALPPSVPVGLAVAVIGYTQKSPIAVAVGSGMASTWLYKLAYEASMPA